MPVVTFADLRTATQTSLTDMAWQRFEVISFFLLVLVGCTWLVQRVWNSLHHEFPVLPRLSFPRAFGVIMLWGLLFVLILTMISGARELMTPGAWEKAGLTYRLVSKEPPASAQITARVESIRRLGERLKSWVPGRGAANEPPAPPDEWLRIDGVEGGRYITIFAKPTTSDWPEFDTRIWAYESEAVGPERLVLLRNGVIQWMPPVEIERCLKEKERTSP